MENEEISVGNARADGGYLDLEMETVEGDAVFAVILTKLPKGFPLQIGGAIEVFKDEILCKAEATEQLA